MVMIEDSFEFIWCLNSLTVRNAIVRVEEITKIQHTSKDSNPPPAQLEQPHPNSC